MIPAMYDLLQGRVSITELREVRVEDLIPVFRDQIAIPHLYRRQRELSGHRRSEEIDIVFTGVRPGEKLFEELQHGGEAIDKARHPKIVSGKIAGRR